MITYNTRGTPVNNLELVKNISNVDSDIVVNIQEHFILAKELLQNLSTFQSI